MEKDNERAKLAYKMFRDAIIKHIAEYYFELEGDVDAIVFTAGILENNIMIREEIVNLLSKPMGISLNKEMNEKIGYGCELKAGKITTDNSKVSIYVEPTNEEIMILRDCFELVNKE